jgi:tRNA threonylcarbamoyladenosine biosynthesis protein TsaB
VDIGPGRFTSLRVGLGTAKGLALGLDLPIVGVSSLRVLARAIEGDAALVRVPVMNAYRGDVFAAAHLLVDGGVEESRSSRPRFLGRQTLFLAKSETPSGGVLSL